MGNNYDCCVRNWIATAAPRELTYYTVLKIELSTSNVIWAYDGLDDAMMTNYESPDYLYIHSYDNYFHSISAAQTRNIRKIDTNDMSTVWQGYVVTPPANPRYGVSYLLSGGVYVIHRGVNTAANPTIDYINGATGSLISSNAVGNLAGSRVDYFGVDAAENVYVASSMSGFPTYSVRRYSAYPTLGLVWTRSVSAAIGAARRPAFHEGNRLLALPHTQGQTVAFLHMDTGVYTYAANVSGLTVRDCRFLSNGNVVLACSILRDPFFPVANEVGLICITPSSGTVVWKKTFPLIPGSVGTTNSVTEASCIEVDSSDNIYIGMRTNHNGIQPTALHHTIFKFDSSGNQLWSFDYNMQRIFTTPTINSIQVHSLALDEANGYLYASGIRYVLNQH